MAQPMTAEGEDQPDQDQTLAPHRLVIDDPVEHERKPEGEEEREVRGVGRWIGDSGLSCSCSIVATISSPSSFRTARPSASSSYLMCQKWSRLVTTGGTRSCTQE